MKEETGEINETLKKAIDDAVTRRLDGPQGDDFSDLNTVANIAKFIVVMNRRRLPVIEAAQKMGIPADRFVSGCPALMA